MVYWFVFTYFPNWIWRQIVDWKNMSSTPGLSCQTKLNPFACNRGHTQQFFIFLHTLPRVRKQISEKLHTKIRPHRFSHRSLCSNGIFDFSSENFMCCLRWVIKCEKSQKKGGCNNSPLHFAKKWKFNRET